VDNPTGSDSYPFSADPTQVNQNTGMERNGGVTAQYEQETTFATAGPQSLVTKSGDLLQVDAAHNIRINDGVIGNVGPYAVSQRGALKGYSDAAWTVGNTIIGIVKIGQTIRVDEVNATTGVVINTRTLTFTMPAVTITNVFFVKYIGMNFADSMTFIMSNNIQAYSLVEANAPTVVSIGGQGFSNFCWKFAANKFIIGSQGKTLTFWIGDIAGVLTAIADATWCVIDQFAGTSFSRAILTFPVKKNAANLLTGIGEVGHNQAGTYNATPTYYGVALAAVTVVIGTHAEGPGYSEATFTRSDTGTNIYYYQAPIMQHTPGQWYDYQQSQTQTLCNGYGRLSDFNGNSLGNTCSLRVMMEVGIPTTITAGVIAQDATYDALGVPITNVGEFDEFFMPHVTDNGSTRLNCVYRYNGVLFFFVIASGATNTLQPVSDNVYMVNCLSPINAIDVANRTLNLGSNDYNGRILFRSIAAIIATVKCVGIMQGPYSNSSDTGDKLITQTFFVASANIVPGIELPSFVDRAVFDYGVNIYLADLYSTTYQSFSVTYTNPVQVGVLYVPDTRIPFAMGYTFYGSVMQTEIETIFSGVGVSGSANIDYDYLGYEIGNDTPGLYQSFYLFGQTYLFDGNNIWLSTFNGSLFSGRGSVPVAPATGTQFIAVSPTEAFFLSTFDNSLYSFNGGRALTKVKRMNDLRNSSNGVEAIINGVYNVRDNTLLMQTYNTFVWVRDGVVSQHNKKATQAGTMFLYDTQSGIEITNGTTKAWIYSFQTQGTTTTTGGTAVSSVVPLTWQSAYHSLKGNELSVAMAWIITVYSPEGPITMPYTLRCHAFDQDVYTLQRADGTIRPSDWDSLGFARMRVQPKNEKALASSIQFDTLQHIVITDVTVLYGDEAQATIAGARSI
jgi:hypothetical protein